MEILSYPEDREAIEKRVFWQEENQSVDQVVASIISRVRKEGDQALCHYSLQFDRVEITPQSLKVADQDLDLKLDSIPDRFKQALQVAIDNIKSFHQTQLPKDLQFVGHYQEKLKQRFTPIERVGVYVPGGSGGNTPLISTLLMNLIPAQLAGCKNIVVMTPPQVDGRINPYLLYAFQRLGVRRIFKVGGAQAIAALAYGTEQIDSVDLIVGPGNQYVNVAKKQVFGKVMIDGLFGHSEIVIVSDGKVDPRYIASDLTSQAEHAGKELVLLITDQVSHAREVIQQMEKMSESLERSKLIKSSLKKRGCVVLVDLAKIELVSELVNRIAPEHLELLVEHPQKYLDQIQHAGAIFIGEYASEPIGDYICGTNHVLPTGRTARFASPLGVYTFLKRTNIIEYNRASFFAYARHAEVLAEVEGLTAHQRALSIRRS